MLNLIELRGFFGSINKIGYSGNKNGTPTYKKDEYGQNLVDGNGELVIDEDVSHVVDGFNSFLDGSLNHKSDNNFSVKYSDIDSRLDLDFYKPSCLRIEKSLLQHNSKRLGEVADIVKRYFPKKFKDEEGPIEYVALADISAEYLEISKSSTMFFHELPSRATYVLKEGDIVTAVAGNSIGSRKHMSAIVSKTFEGAICTNGLRILKPNQSIINPYYLLSYLRTKLFLDQILRYRTGAAIPAISDVDLLNILVYIPPMKHQEKIAAQIRRSIQLREEAKKLIEEIDLGISL